MADPIEALLILAGACVSSAAIGASFVFGVAMVCRWLEWAPVNTTVNIYNKWPSDDVSTTVKSDG
jgi:hypothetical protein